MVDKVLAGLGGWLGEAGFLTPNEKRAAIGLDPLDDGDRLAPPSPEGAPPRPFDRGLAEPREAKTGEAEERPDLDTVIVKIWRTQGDGTVRDSHVAADGQVRLEDEMFDVGSAKLREPRDPDGPPGETFNCRCILERCPVTALEGEDRKRAEERLQLAQRRRGGPGQSFTPGQELARAQWFNALDTIRRHNPQDPILTFVAPPRFVPTPEQVVRARETARIYESASFTIHGEKQRAIRDVPLHLVVETIRKGRRAGGNTPGTTVYELPSLQSSNGRGVKVIVDTKTGRIVTVIDKGRDFK